MEKILEQGRTLYLGFLPCANAHQSSASTAYLPILVYSLFFITCNRPGVLVIKSDAALHLLGICLLNSKVIQ